MMLTLREEEILSMITCSNKEIAVELNIEVKTVKFHKTNLFRKLGVKCAREIYRKNSQINQIKAQTAQNLPSGF